MTASIAVLEAAWRLLRLLPPRPAYTLTHRLAHPALLRALASRPPWARVPGEYRGPDGTRLDNPVGLAAGLDKDGDHTWIPYTLGLGYATVGSVLPRPHPGHPRKVLARLPDGALVNRLGLPSKGAAHAARRLARWKPPIPVAANIAGLAPEDYEEAYKALAPHASWIEVNISCPNTREHTTFEDPDQAHAILRALTRLTPRRPILLKIPRTLDRDTLQAYADIVHEAGAHGIVAANTRRITWRDGEPAGLSGPPVYQETLQITRLLRERLRGTKTLIAVGGIDTPQKAERLLEEGADLLQILTVLLAKGPRATTKIIQDLKATHNKP